MILKSSDSYKINLKQHKFILFYGVNEGYKNEILNKIISQNKNKSVSRYDEKYILENLELILNDIFSKSFFDNEKIIIIKQASDKILNFIDQLSTKELEDINIFIISNKLDKKSILRKIFETNKEFICSPFYEDTKEILANLAISYLKEKKISLSREDINLIVNRVNGDRINLINELKKVELFSSSGKKITTSEIAKLTNLTENHTISELIDATLLQNLKKTQRIINENNFISEDMILIIRSFLNKFKKMLVLLNKYIKNKDLNQTILEAKPPIFWKDKQIIKDQLQMWKINQIKKFIYELSELEISVKKNPLISLQLVNDYIFKINLIKTNN